jgi:hypothetical protein
MRKAVPEVKPNLSIVGMSNNGFHIMGMPAPYFTLATIEFHEGRDLFPVIISNWNLHF